MNRRFCQLLGLPRRRLLGMGWIDSVHPEDRERVLARRRGALGDVESFEIRYRVLREGAAPVWVRANPVALYYARGKFMGRIGTLTRVPALGARSHAFEKLGVKRRSQAATLYARIREARPQLS